MLFKCNALCLVACATICLSFAPLTSGYSHIFGKPPQAVIHLPENVLKGKDRVQINHHALSEYLSAFKDIPNTLHEHGRILAQLDHSALAQHLGQSVNSGRLPLISITSSNAPAGGEPSRPAKVAYELHSDGYASAYNGPQMLNSPADAYSTGPAPALDYAAAPESAGPMNQPAQANYGNNQDNNQYEAPQQQSQQMPPQQQQQAPQPAYYGESNSGNNNNNNNNGYGQAASGQGYGMNEPQPANDYGNNGGNNNGYAVEGAGGYELVGSNGDSNSIAEYGRSYAGDSSPFDFNFVQDILSRVMQQLEQQQITPEQLQAYGEPEESHSNDNNQNNYQSGASNYGAQSSGPSSYSAPQQSLNMNNAHTIAFRVPTIRYELPDTQIEQLMQAISGNYGANSGGNVQYGAGSQPVPIMMPARRIRLPTPIGMGSVRTIAVIKSSRLPSLKHLPQLSGVSSDGAYAASAPKASRVRPALKKSPTPAMSQLKRNKNASSRSLSALASTLKMNKKPRAKPCDEDKKKKKK